MSSACALVMAGGTGGHIFPGLAVAEALRERAWRVHWLGGAGQHGKPAGAAARLRLRDHRFFRRARQGPEDAGAAAAAPAQGVLAEHRGWCGACKPDVVVGLGGYITFPAGMMSVLLGKPLVLHEQNSVAGMANRILAGVADRVFTRLPQCAEEGGLGRQPAARRLSCSSPGRPSGWASRSGPLRLLVVGGSLGAKALNDIVPKALALIPAERRPIVLHQSGAKQIDELRANYAAAGVQAELTPFIEDTAQAYAEADLIVCRAGASTVTEIAAVGAAAVFVPFPFAVDDHQTTNARFLVDAGGGWLVQQRDLRPEWLADLIQDTHARRS